MTLSYRTRRYLYRLAVVLLFLILIAALVWLCWLLWLERYVVYTQDGAELNFNLSADGLAGQVAVPPSPEETISIYYNEGDDAVSTGTELTQLMGYYADSAALSQDIDAVRSQIEALPLGTPVMLDVKNISGYFFYSTTVGADTSSSVDVDAVDELIAYLKTSGLYTIARLPAFRDYSYGLNHVSDGLPTSKGYLWMDDSRCYWLNPASEGTITYLIQIVTELKDLGFDEVVFTDFRFPDTKEIVFKGDKTEALSTAAAGLVSACATESFAVSFTGQDAAFPLPDGRSRLYLDGVAAADAASVAEQTGLADTQVNLVFLTEINDTRFDEYGVLRPLASAHFE